MPHKRSPYAEERALAIRLAVYDSVRRELIAQKAFSMEYFSDGMVLRGSYGRGAFQLREREEERSVTRVEPRSLSCRMVLNGGGARARQSSPHSPLFPR
jgi:hypothetical protein